MKKLKKISAVFIAFAIFMLSFPTTLAADAPTVVYTEFTSTNNDHSGDGTKQSPYNLMQDAIDAVADGGTIYIGEGGAFLNDENDGQPMKITKNVTITRASDVVTRPTFTMRKGGIVLGANVSFENITLSFPNANHAVICANGYTLEAKNVSQSSSTRVIHISGGSLLSSNAASLSPESGSESRIVISGSDTKLGNVYAGSINGGFDGKVDMEISDVSSGGIGDVYGSGAKEGYYNGENWLDPYNEPEAPEADGEVYPVSGKVTLKLSDSSVSNVYGENSMSVEVSSTYWYSCSLSDITLLSVKNGTFAPKTLNSDADVSVSEGGTLDLSELGECAVHDFYGDGGRLMLSADGCLTVNGTLYGNAVFCTSGTGIAAYNHLYIKADGEGSFDFEPYSTQSDMTLVKKDGGFWTSEKEESVPTLTAFDIENTALTVTKSCINGSLPPEIQVTASYTEDTDFEDIGMIPLKYTVEHGGKTIGPISSVESDYEGYYECSVAELYMNFVPIDSSISISSFGTGGEIETGVYKITVTAPTETGDVSKTVILTVTADDGSDGEDNGETGDNGDNSETGGSTDNGDNGDNSETGDSGETGDNGETGDSGDSENNGESGDTGDNSETGDNSGNGDSGNGDGEGNGDTGDNGDNGDNGETGDNGDNGNGGDSGESGETGDSGDTGNTGDSTDTVWTVSGLESGNVSVTFKNLGEDDINNAVIIAAVYDEYGALLKTAASENNISAEKGAEAEVSFDFSDVSGKKIKLFIWNSLSGMEPLCDGYIS